jgi:Predicted transcriptional regulator
MKEKEITSAAVRFWLDKKGVRQGELASGVGVESSTISQIVNAKRLPSMELAMKIADYFAISLAEFFACKDETKPDIAYVEKVKARPRAGTGGLETDSDHNGYYSFHTSFLARKKGNSKTMKIFEVAGDSMTPTLDDGDMIMVNTTEKDVQTGRVYLLRIGEDLMVKRLETRPGGVMMIRSDNPDYDDIPVNLHEVTDVEVFGRMVWSCREY